ncbi:Hypothetical predicted protein [Marmota monax]|uniref:Uncharacterized protein n=1 Tax=Marmota monax TaxID=9995 RepID=A0A5E4A6K2_MARMO|nr:hypothetical protein GHT09_008828 [Marmota monax]VTJ52625.1 Hypothetical predicted protein [Marmota monax]
MDETQSRRTDSGVGIWAPRLTSCQYRVVLQLCAPPRAEAGASAGPDELSVERPGPCSPSLRSWPPLPHPCHRCPDSRCIKNLKRSPPYCLPDSAAAATIRCHHSNWEPLSTPIYIPTGSSSLVGCFFISTPPPAPMPKGLLSSQASCYYQK